MFWEYIAWKMLRPKGFTPGTASLFLTLRPPGDGEGNSWYVYAGSLVCLYIH